MEFAFDDDQQTFGRTAGDLLRSICGPDVVRAAWAAAPGRLERGPWERLVELGVPAALLDESAGGLGLDERWLALVLEEAGRVALPHPIVETALVLPTVSDVGASGAIVATDLGGPLVPCAADADELLLTAAGALHLVPRDSVEVEPIESIDRARRLGRVAWTPSAATVVTDDPASIERALLRGAFGTAAMLLGLGGAMLDLTVGYVRDRHQFGVPVGSFQAVKHQLADTHLALSFARPAVHRAAWSLAVGAPTRGRDVAMAKAMASDAAVFAGRRALQCHGAMGYTVEYDLHLYLKRAVALSASWGSAAHHRRTVAVALGLHQPDDQQGSPS